MATATETINLRYNQVPETSESLDWADLVTLDLSKFNRSGGKEELAKEFQRAIEEVGTSLVTISKIPIATPILSSF